MFIYETFTSYSLYLDETFGNLLNNLKSENRSILAQKAIIEQVKQDNNFVVERHLSGKIKAVRACNEIASVCVTLRIPKAMVQSLVAACPDLNQARYLLFCIDRYLRKNNRFPEGYLPTLEWTKPSLSLNLSALKKTALSLNKEQVKQEKFNPEDYLEALNRQLTATDQQIAEANALASEAEKELCGKNIRIASLEKDLKKLDETINNQSKMIASRDVVISQLTNKIDSLDSLKDKNRQEVKQLQQKTDKFEFDVKKQKDLIDSKEVRLNQLFNDLQETKENLNRATINKQQLEKSIVALKTHKSQNRIFAIAASVLMLFGFGTSVVLGGSACSSTAKENVNALVAN